MPTHLTNTVYLNTFQGSHYDIGREKGYLVKERHEGSYIDQHVKRLRESSFYRKLGDPIALGEDLPETAKEAERILQAVHPGLLDKLLGFADGLGEDPDKVLGFCASAGINRGCSHFVTHHLHAHNYEDSPRYIDSQFSIINSDDSYASGGFSNRYIGRLDGMNEWGLSVSLSYGGVVVPRSQALEPRLCVG